MRRAYHHVADKAVARYFVIILVLKRLKQVAQRVHYGIRAFVLYKAVLYGNELV